MRENETRWKELCALAQKEQDPTRLRELVHEINNLLTRKQERLDVNPVPKTQAGPESNSI
jgi:hypothetical protein